MESERGHEFSENIEEGIETKHDFYHTEISELQEPLESIVEQLQESIEHGDYSTIIGDDASGRIPTLILERIISGIYSDRGLPRTKTLFLTGSGSGGYELTHDEKFRKGSQIYRLLYKSQKSAMPHQGGRALIVTESIRSGRSLAPLTDELHRLSIDFDIAAVGIDPFFSPENPQVEKKILEERLGTRLFFGMRRTPSIYGRYNIAGVQKNASQLHSEVYIKNNSWPGDKEAKREQQLEINEARADVAAVADTILAHFRSRHP